MDRKRYIIMITEGQKTEKQIIENLQGIFLKKDDKNKNIEIIVLPFRTNIYTLWSQLKKDNFETNILDILAERDKDIRDQLEKTRDSHLDRYEVSEIYLFFDYDGHAWDKKDEVDNIISQMIDTFDNETEHGKIYISYPMVEAIKDLKKQEKCWVRCKVPAKENIRYKQRVEEDTKDFQNLKKLDKNDWNLILINNVKKASCIVSSKFSIPKYKDYVENLTQKNIFENQKSKFISKENNIAVLSGFPFFLIDYFEEDFFKKIFKKNKFKKIVIDNKIRNKLIVYYKN